MTARITSPEVTVAQKKQVARLVEDVMQALGLTKDGAQRLLEKGGVFKDKLTPIFNELSAEKFPCHIHASELVPNGYTVVEDVEPTPSLDIEKLEYIGFLEWQEKHIGGEEVQKRAVKLKGNLGLSDAKYLLANQAKIPTELRGKYIVLPGTVLRNTGGDCFVPYLVWSSGRWILRLYLLSSSFDGDDRLVRSK